MRTVTFLALLFLAVTAFAQSAEYGRASGGSIEMIAKAPKAFSGSLGLTHATGLFGGRGYEGTLGGEILKDKVWFFGSASMATKVETQPVDWTHMTASYMESPQTRVPSTFLSLRSTSMVSDRMVLNVSVSQKR